MTPHIARNNPPNMSLLPVSRFANVLAAALEDVGYDAPATITAPCCGYAAAPGSTPDTVGKPYKAMLEIVPSEGLMLVSRCTGCGAVAADNRHLLDAPGPISDYHLTDGHPLAEVAAEDLDGHDRLDAVATRAKQLATTRRWKKKWQEATNPYDFHRGTDYERAQAVVVEMIDEASHYIHLITYTTLSKDVSAAIVSAAKRGVVVRVVYDGKQTKDKPLDPLPEDDDLSMLQMRPAGALPDDLLRKTEFHGHAEHGKVLVIDGIIGILGSLNLSYTGMLRVAHGETTIFETRPALVAELNNDVFVDRWFRAAMTTEEDDAVLEVYTELTGGGDQARDPMSYDSPGEAQARYRYFMWHVRATLALGKAQPLLLVPVHRDDGGDLPPLRAV